MHVPGYSLQEVIHRSPPRVIYRATRDEDGKAVAVKTLADKYPSKQDVAELAREYEIVDRLQGTDGVIEVHTLVPYGEGNLAIVMELFGLSLEDFMVQRERRPMAVQDFFPLAIQIARILGRVHESQVVHKDVVPRNVLLDDREVRLIDFGISSELSSERQDVIVSRRLRGSLPYISPEQTGRMNRSVDFRSDYYSLGVTYFELLTGTRPFSAGNVLEWVHQHISKLPPSPRSVQPSIPGPLSDVVLKLMAKNAEDRYQSTYGLVADLERCRSELEDLGSIAEFQLGLDDVPSRFQIPQRLYGRDDELAQLRTSFEWAASGHTEFSLVSGYAGVGKSALVNELAKSIASEKGYLIEGKFDQFKQRTAYSAVSVACRGLCRQLLAEPPERLAAWREALSAALGTNGQVIVDLVPELGLIIGEQPHMAELPATEAQNRLQIVFLSFVKVFATSDHPLVIFIDDLQWADVPSLNLLQRLVTARDTGHLLVIGAYRSNEVDTAHPLRLMLDDVRKARTTVDVDLSPLVAEAIAALTSDALHCEVERSRPLAELLFDKSRGNPFFVNELLKGLHEDGAIVFDSDQGRWQWDLEAVRRAQISDNVVDFMVASLRRLPGGTQRALRLAACIGSAFDLRTLGIISEQGSGECAVDLLEALKRNIVVPLDESYKYAESESVNPWYKFQHDRVQQAAYALIEEERKREVHLSIGRLIERHCDEEERGERLIDIVSHLNHGRQLIDDPKKRRELAELNLEAGIKAHGSSAYSSALDFLEVGIELLADDAWESDHELAMELNSEFQQCAYLTGRYREAEALSATLLERARTAFDKAEVLSTRTRQYSTIGKMPESIEAAIEGLRLLGYEITNNPSPGAIEAEQEAVVRNLGDREIADLIHAEPLTDPESQIAIRLLMEIFPAAFLSGSGNLFPYLVLKSVSISLEHGTGPESAFAYAAYGMLLCGALDDPALGYRYGRLAVAMNELLDDIKLKSRVIYVYAMFVHHWSEHWSSMTPWFKRGIESGYQSGDLLYLAYSAQDCIIWDPTLDLEVAAAEQEKYLTIVRDCEYQDSLDSGTLFLQMQLNFLDRTRGLLSMDTDEFDEQACLAGMLERGFMTGVANYHIYKAEIAWFYGALDEAYEHVLAQDELIASAMSLPQLVRFYIVAFLVRAARYHELDEGQQRTTLERLRSDLERMTRWAENCRDNFLHLQLMMQGELARLEGETVDALNYFDLAIDAARASGFRRDEAMANELAGAFLYRSGRQRASEGYLRAAYYLYYRWGAKRKVQHLRDSYADALWISAPATSTTVEQTHESTGTWTERESIDMHSVMRASQAISGELRLGQLWKKTLDILLENVGGQRGWFVTREDGNLLVEARSEVGSDAPAISEPIAIRASDKPAMLPISVLNSALRTGEPVILNNAVEDGLFATDPYIVRERPKSVICIPILRHGKFEGAIYIENTLTIGAFTSERVEVIKLLSAQASISMENAKLYGEQVRLVEAQQRFVPSQFLESLGHPDIARVGLGEHVAKEMSVMFSDLRGFTPLAERLGPGSVIELLNGYFSSQSPPISQAGGFIDAFTGDEIMALFDGTPDAAIRAGVGMRRALEEFNRRSVAEGGPALQAGIGMDTGPLVLGTVGGQNRLQCGVVGDIVNLSSRIEQLTKRYDVPFLIGDGTYERLVEPELFSFRMVDRVAVVGRVDPVTLYEVLDAESPERQRAKEATRDLLAEAHEHVVARRFADGLDRLVEAARLDPDDGVLSLLKQRTEGYLKDPPPPTWRGYETLHSK